jgi:hypothetical protein
MALIVEDRAAVSGPLFHREDQTALDPVDRWFRQLDQRRILQGSREWLVQVTGILRDEDDIWIQIADDTRWCGSVLLRVRDTASVEQAVGALASRDCNASRSYPRVITVGVIGRVA